MVRMVIDGMVIHGPPYSWSERMNMHKLNGSVATTLIGLRPPRPETPTSTEPQPMSGLKPGRKKSRTS
jgi:hypothetical protein